MWSHALWRESKSTGSQRSASQSITKILSKVSHNLPSGTAELKQEKMTTITENNQSASGAVNGNGDVARWGLDLDSTLQMEDWYSAWQEVLEGKGVWGGRTRGGRGVQRITGLTNDISVEGITLAFCGKELLTRTSLKLVHGHRYGLIGENGVGKSTLLRRLAKRSVPGIPLHFRFGYVQQELPVAEDMTVLEYVLKAAKSLGSATERLQQLRKDEEQMEQAMEVSRHHAFDH